VVTVLRGLPEILVVFFIFFGGTHLLFILTDEFYDISPFWSGVLALSLIFAAYASQTLRAAIQSVPKGQLQAARALGMGPVHSFIRVTLPQAWRLALPGLGNQWMVLLKDTALVSLIGVTDLMKQADLLSGSSYKPFTFLIAAAAIYLIITLISQWLLTHLNSYINRFDAGVAK
jgi:arginine transport system permease protein